MALAATYQQFLAAPSSSHLANEATLHYITTTTSYRGSADILKHVSALRSQLKKKKEDYLSIIQGQDAIAVEVDTALEFVTSGGPYLPALDDNFLIDRTVYLPITHIVVFGPDGKILQIRQTWDQGSLLKQLDIIGKTGRNWPIRDSRDQIKMIGSCAKLSEGVAAVQQSSELSIRSHGSSTSILRDPHASLSLFAHREEPEQNAGSFISPRGGIRPRQRDITEILGDEPVDASASPSANRQRSESPSKAVAPKAGAGKNFQPSRLFESDEPARLSSSVDAPAESPERFYRPNPKKYSHFDFADGSDPVDAPKPSEPIPTKTKHSSQWTFDDFVTPAKPKPSKSIRQQDVRHWGTEDDQTKETPVRKPVISKPRRDAETHFDFVDDGIPKGEARVAKPRGATHNTGLGLYQNNLYDEDGNDDTPAGEPQALGTITNLKDRGRDFASHWLMTDDSPAQGQQPKPLISDDRKKAVKMMDANWSAYDQSPTQKENKPQDMPSVSKAGENRGIAIAGDGMGGGKGSNRNWFFGEDDEVETTKSVPGRKQATAKSAGFDWDF
ncbi:hypothetical protein F4778DRAFT_619383 [Xylariomycetidae sp. FL2044]|nr:hypothetical protein F4778DRAFT_619383 [Xylariomycetidae sp. FL2044]